MSHTGHGNTSVLKEKSPLREVLRAVVKHFSPTRVHKSQFWPFSTEQGRCFFHCRCMPGTGAIRWGDISFRTRPRRPIEPPILTRRTRDQQTGGAGVMGTEGHGRGAGGRRQGQERTEQHQRPGTTGVEGAGGTGGHGRGAGGRQHGQNKHTRPKPRPIGGRRGACRARPRCRRAAAGPGQTTSQRTEQHQRPGTTGVEGAGGTGGPGRGAGGRQHGQNKHTRPKPHPIGGRREAWGQAAVPEGGGGARAGLEIGHSEPSGSRVAISRAGRRPPAHTAARPIKASHTAPGTPVGPQATPEIRRVRKRHRHNGRKETPTAPGTP